MEMESLRMSQEMESLMVMMSQEVGVLVMM